MYTQIQLFRAERYDKIGATKIDCNVEECGELGRAKKWPFVATKMRLIFYEIFRMGLQRERSVAL